MKKLKIVFMGTPDFAVPVLKALQQSGYPITCVVTQPDRPKGRGRKPAPPPVKIVAEELGCPILQPASVTTDTFYTALADISADVFIVVAFGHILPQRLLDLPRYGAINIHASLLPKYRGPAPIQWAIINREKRTGVTSMLLDTGVDTGDMLLTKETDIFLDDTAQSLHDRLAGLGGTLIVDTLEKLTNQSIIPIAQDNDQATHAPLLKKEDGHIQWQRTAVEIEALIRGMTPWPGAFTFFGKRRLKLFKAKTARMETNASPGMVIKGFDQELRIATGNQALSVLELQSASGKRLSITDFLRGTPIPIGSILT